MTSATETQEPLSMHFYHWLNPRTILQKSLILSVILGFIRYHANLSKTSKMKELIISESRNQHPRYSGNLSLHFYHWLELKRIFQKSIILWIIQSVPPTSCQIQWNVENIAYNFWVTWRVPKIPRKLYLCTFSID